MTITDQERACFSPDWAISRDLEAALLELLDQLRPRTVIELGAGLSTILLLRYAEQTGARTIHLDQSGPAHAKLLRCLELAGLCSDSVRACPIIDDFYSPAWTADCDRPFDLVLIDGPRGSRGRTCANSIEFLQRVIGPQSALIVDDTNRAPEAKLARLIKRWYGVNHFARIDVRDSVFTHRISTILVPKPKQ